MGSLRFGKVADAVSGGLDLFIGREAENERTKINQQWELAMANMREKHAGKREDRAIAREDAREGRAVERHAASLAASGKEGELNRGARREQFDLQQVSRAEETLFKRLDDLREQQAEATEAAAYGEEGALDAINRRYQGLADDMILGHVVRMSQGSAPGYEMNDAGALESKFIQMGMDTAGAADHAKNIGSQLWPDQAADAGPDKEQFVPSGNYSYTDVDGKLVGGGERGNQAAREAALFTDPVETGASQNATAGTIPVDMVGESGNIPEQQRDGSLKSLFSSEPIRNPDGTSKYPGNKDAFAYKVADWLNRPATELFGKRE